jgi:hypothetical protein
MFSSIHNSPDVSVIGRNSSGADYLRGCFSNVLDLAIARNIRVGGSRNVPAARPHVQRA